MIINWGDAPFKAFITVSYPRGTLTVSGEGQSYSHTGGGTHTFTVRKKGTYSVNAVDGGKNDSASVNVTAGKQSLSVKLEYRFYVVKNGVPQVGLKVNNFTYSTVGSYLRVYYNGSGYHRIGCQINLTEFSVIKATVSCKSSYGARLCIWHQGQQNLTDENAASAKAYVGQNSSFAECSLNVSAFSNQNFHMYFSTSGSSEHELRIRDWYLVYA
jgi:hypothetical protein